MSYPNMNAGFCQPPNQGYSPAPGYPPTSGYPQAPGGAPGYPPASGYPQAPGGAPGYPPTPGYPPAPGGAPGYPQAAGYAMSAGGAPGYPGAQGYPQAGGAPGSGYPGQAPGYNPATAYPGTGAPGYPGASPTQSPGYPASPACYSAQNTQGAPQVSAAAFSQDQPTIRQIANFDPSADAALLRKAMKGFGTDEASIINVLANRTSEQRQRIILGYKQAYGKDLIKDLKSELGGNLERIVLAMMKPTQQLLAEDVHKAMQGLGTNEDTLVEILCTRTNKEIKELKESYYKMYKKQIDDDLAGETSGHFRRLLISMSTGARDEDNMNVQLAPGLAQQLYKAGEGKVGTDESEFNRILASYSYPILRETFQEYRKIKGKSLVDAIRSEFSGDIKNGLVAVVMSIENRPFYFAKCLHESMAGGGTRDGDLIRLVVTRSEVDLGTIKQEYQRVYGKSLESAIKGDTSGDYKKMLLGLCE